MASRHPLFHQRLGTLWPREFLLEERHDVDVVVDKYGRFEVVTDEAGTLEVIPTQPGLKRTSVSEAILRPSGHWKNGRLSPAYSTS
jgi:hypothetical protein